MNTEFYTFGEILWDCLPSGRHAGGAPFNVAAHLAQLGVSVSLLSSVGQDALGDEILDVAKNKGVNVQFVDRARIGLPTGTVIATIDALGNATYELVQPVAWDEIIVSEEAFAAVAKAGAFIFGSLAGRSPYNLQQLDRLLDIKGPLKFFDVNLRPPFADPKRIVELAARADVLKLNHDEVGQIASWLRTGEATPNPPGNAGGCRGSLCDPFEGHQHASDLRDDGLRGRGALGSRQPRDRFGSENSRQGHRWRGRCLHGRPDGRADTRSRRSNRGGNCLPSRCHCRLA